MKSALEIAHEAQLRPISEVASGAGILPEELEQCGEFRGKVRLSTLDRLSSRKNGKLVIVTAITPTKAGEGKTTTSVALTMGLGKIGKKVMLCLREPSMGPVFGVKGGGTGGGYAQVGPMEEINLHFNGDFHAVTAAHNLLAAALDASIYNGNPLHIDPSTISWPRTVDMNDRELRYSVVGLGGKTHGVPREHQFVITAASEVMAIFALSNSLADLRRRLGRIVVATTYTGEPVTAEMLKVAGAMTVVMKDAIKPNIVQTLEGQPALALWAAQWPGNVKLDPFHLVFEATPDGYSLMGWPDQLSEVDPKEAAVLLLGDPYTFPADVFLNELNTDRPGLRVVGGMSSGQRGPGVQQLLLDDRVHDQGAIGLLMSGPMSPDAGPCVPARGRRPPPASPRGPCNNSR